MASPSLVAEPADVAEVQDEGRLIAALRNGDEAAFCSLVDTYHAQMSRVARAYVVDPAVADEVVQETWLRVLRGIDRFESRSSLKTWMFRILVNLAIGRATRERRSIPLSHLALASEGLEPAVEPGRFRPADSPLWPGHWTSFPASWGTAPEARLLAGEVRDRIRAAIEALPPAQRTVVALRDVEGWTSEDVCNALQISESNQRVLLHRGRSRVRRALELYLTGN
jgi:RNA polymerase sigma-70 factor, ECF subfamily